MTFGVRAAGVDYIPVFLKIGVDLRQEGRVDFVFGQDVVVVDRIVRALVRHLQGVGQHFRMVREECCHLLFALEKLLLGVAEALRVVDIRIGGQADQAVVGRAVFAADEVYVVGSHHLHAHLFRKLEDTRIDLGLRLIDVGRNAGHFRFVEHHLQVVVLPEEVLVPADGFARGVQVARHDILGNLAGQAGGAADQVVVILLDHLVRDAGAIVESFNMTCGTDLHQVPVTVIIFGQQNQVVIFVVRAVFQMMIVMTGHIDLAADDGFDDQVAVSVFVGFVVRPFEKLLHAVHVAVVRDGERRHLQLPCPGEKFLNIRESVENRILRMDV